MTGQKYGSRKCTFDDSWSDPVWITSCDVLISVSLLYLNVLNLKTFLMKQLFFLLHFFGRVMF